MSKGWWSGHKVVDPVELEARFAVEDGLGFLDIAITEELSQESEADLDRVKDTLDKIPRVEADFVELYFFLHLKQTAIADIFKVSQPTVCYRLKRAAERIRYLLALPELDEGELEEVLEAVLDDELDRRIMLLMFETTCQSEVAKRLGVTQGLVRHRFIRSIGRLDKAGGQEKYVDLFMMVKDNLNMLREVQRPSWKDQVAFVLG